MPTNKKPWEAECTELPDGTLVCTAHQLTICGKCCVDYTFMNEYLTKENNETAEDDGETPLTDDEMRAFRARMVAKKGCACFLPLKGSGCENCDSAMKSEPKVDVAKNEEETKSRVVNKT